MPAVSLTLFYTDGAKTDKKQLQKTKIIRSLQAPKVKLSAAVNWPLCLLAAAALRYFLAMKGTKIWSKTKYEICAIIKKYLTKPIIELMKGLQDCNVMSKMAKMSGSNEL